MIRFLSAGAIVRLAMLLVLVGLAPAPAGAQSHVDVLTAGPPAGPGSVSANWAPSTNAPASGNVPGANQAAAGTNQPPIPASGNSSPAAGSNPMAGSANPPHVGSPIDFASGQTVSQSEQTTFLAMTRFTQALLDPFVGGRGAVNTVQSGAVDQLHWNVWASGIGASLSGNGNAAAPGSGSVSSRIFGTVVGADYSLSPQTMAGFAMAGGGTYFNVGNFGSGRSDLFQAGAFVRHTVGQAYVAAALAYGWQAVASDRAAGVVASDPPNAALNANAYSGRVESGYRLPTPLLGIAAYAAGQFTTYNFPVSTGSQFPGAGPATLALGTASATDSRSELGVRTDKSLVLGDGVLNLRGALAWAHDVRADRSVSPAFQAVSGSGFVASGSALAFDSALTTVSAEMRWSNSWLAAATFEGEFSGMTRSYTGKAVVRYAW